MSWIKNNSRSYMSSQDVINHVMNKVKTRDSAALPLIMAEQVVSPRNSSVYKKWHPSLGGARQKGQFLNKLVQFWSGKSQYEPGLLNKNLLMTTRLLIARGLDDEKVEHGLNDLCHFLSKLGFRRIQLIIRLSLIGIFRKRSKNVEKTQIRVIRMNPSVK